MKKAVLIDVSAIMYRAYFSLMNMKNSNQEPTGAIYGFINTFLSIIDEFNPDYIAACYDVNRETLNRTKIYKDYKKDREAMPEDLVSQIKGIEKFLKLYNVQTFKIPGFEADDLLGTLSKKLANEGVETFVVTGDKDLAQILDDNIKIALLSKGKEKFKVLSSEDDVVNHIGVKASVIPDLFGLQGDSSDGIPGVKGVGPKTGVKLLNEYGDIEGIYENIDKIKGKLKEKLENDKEKAFLSRKLAIIDQNVEVDFNLDELKLQNYSPEIEDFFKKYDFNSLLSKFNFKKDEELIEELEINYEVATDIEYVSLLLDEEEVAIYRCEAGIGVYSPRKCFYIPIFHNYIGAKNIKFDNAIGFLNQLKSVTAYNHKELIKIFGNQINFDFDVMLAYYVLHSDDKCDFEDIVKNEKQINLEKYKDGFGKESSKSKDIDKVAEYCVNRAGHIYSLKKRFLKNLKKHDLYDIYNDIEMKTSKVLAKMEKAGIIIDINYFKRYNSELRDKIGKLENEIYEIAGKEFNINSPKQLQDILFVDLGLMPIKKTKTGYSTDNEVLERLKEMQVPIAEKLIDYRTYNKLLTTYVDNLPKLADENARLHTTFLQEGTATGRLSSVEPNLQNIPSKTEEGMKIRQGFIPKEGYTFLSADYSQIELRVLAEICGDKSLVDAYNNGLDLHFLTASKIFDKESIEEVTREERTIAKIVNFSIIYGKTPYGLSKEINISPKEAKLYIEKYFEKYKGVKDFIENSISEAENNGYIKTMFGRKRYISGINSKNKNIKQHGERMAVNSIIQGSAADILKKVMIDVYENFKDTDDINLLLQVHDELLFEIKDDKVDEYEKQIKDIMQNSIKFEKVPLIVNINKEKRWSEAK